MQPEGDSTVANDVGTTTADPVVLPAWKVTELAVLASQVALKYSDPDPSSVDVFWNLNLLDPDGSKRQVEVVVEYARASRRVRRIVEVQNKPSKPLDKMYLGGFADKSRELGAERVTIVTTAGYTEPALKRLRRERDLFDAYRLVTLDPDHAVGDLRGVDTAALAFQLRTTSDDDGRWLEVNPVMTHGRLVDALSGDVVLNFAYGTAEDHEMGFRFFLSLIHVPGGGLSYEILQPFESKDGHRPVGIAINKAQLLLSHLDGQMRAFVMEHSGGGPLKPTTALS